MSQSSDSLQVSGVCCWCEALSDIATVVIVLSVVCFIWALGQVTVFIVQRQERSYCGVRTEAEETAEYPAYNKTTQQMAALSRGKINAKAFIRIKK